MLKILALAVGSGIGVILGALAALLLAPATSEQFKERLRAHYAQALEAGRKAAEQRRQELEEELKRLRERA